MLNTVPQQTSLRGLRDCRGDALRRRQPLLGSDLKVRSDPACLTAMGDLIVDRAGLTLYAGMTQFYLDGCHDVIF